MGISKIILGAVAIGFIYNIATSNNDHKSQPALADGESVVIPSAKAATPVPEADPATWLYTTKEDKMTGKQVKSARLESVNTISLDFPYHGVQHGTLYIRNGDGKDVMFYVQRGQILCRVYECDVKVRFDDQAPITFKASPPADHSSETVFIGQEGKFIAMMSKAKRVRIEVNMFQAGTQVFEFNVINFNREAVGL